MIRFLIVVSLMLLPFSADAATKYMSTTGSNSNDGAEGTPYLTLAYAMSHISGGDTLIIEDGTYTGSANALNGYLAQSPPVGTSGAYTIIKARNNGAVKFDGQGTSNMFYVAESSLTAKYWQFEGIIWTGGPDGPVHLRYCSYVKFLRCGAYDTPNGNYANFSINYSDYILLEGCYAWGSGRYKFMAFHSSHVIFRQCIGRPDSINAGGEPAAVYAAYSSTYVKFQNCIAIDADQTAYWTNVGDRQGAFFVPCTDGVSQYVDFDQSIALNVKLGGLQTASNTDSANVTFSNVVVWDSTDNGDVLNMIRGSSNTIINSTFGYSDSTSTAVFYWDGASGSMTNSIMYHLLTTGGGFMTAAPATQNYNLYYANTNNAGRTGANDLTTTDPTTNSLKYLPRIETGGTLKGAGSGGADIGANALKLIGVSGTLYGESGYATVQSTNMWPFPNEVLIKSKMAAYSGGGVNGARGFATIGKQLNGTSDVTLTSYIWEYLGNAIPADIYSTDPINGVCGTSSGQSFATTPTTNLCLAGTATSVSGTGPWTWGCNGANGGTSTSSCSATLAGQAVSAVFRGSKITGSLK